VGWLTGAVQKAGHLSAVANDILVSRQTAAQQATRFAAKVLGNRARSVFAIAMLLAGIGVPAALAQPALAQLTSSAWP
jgi:hypothetical protein